MRNSKRIFTIIFLISLISFIGITINNTDTISANAATYSSDDEWWNMYPYSPNITVTPPNVTVNVPDQSKVTTEGDKGIISKLTDLPGKIVDSTLDVLGKPIRDYLQADAKKNAQQLNMLMDFFIDLLSDESLGSGKLAFARGLWSALKPIGVSLLSLFFIVGYVKKAISLELMDIQQIAKVLIKLSFAKVLLDKSYELLSMIVSINSRIVNTVFAYLGNANSKEIFQYVNTNADIGIVQAILNSMKTLWFSIFIGLCLIICAVMVVIRQINIAVLTSTSTLFFSTFGGDSTTSVFVNFLKNYVSVVAQTTWISVALAFLMNGYISSLNVNGQSLLDGGSFIVGVIALAVYCIQAPSSVRNAIGGSGGDGLNLSSVVMMLR